MIKAIDLTNARDSAVIYRSVLEQINMFVETDKDLAGELAMAAIQTVICGETNSDNPVVQAMIMPMKQASEKNYQRYAKTCESKRETKIRDLRLEEIAELAAQGMSTRQIESELDIPRSTVSYRLGIIKSDYPELLPNEVSNCPTCPTYENENENVIDIETESESERGEVVEFGQAEHQPASASASDKSSDDYILSLIKKYKPFKNNSGMLAFQEIPKFGEMEAINHYLSNHPEAIYAA